MAVATAPTDSIETAPAPVLLEDDRWERVLAATGGWAAACYQCGLCSGVCPWGLVRDEPVSIRKLVRRAQLGLDSQALSDPNDMLWLCTTCRACELPCPRGVPITDVVLGLRELAWQQPWLDRPVPEGMASVLWDTHFDGNPWGRPPSQRTAWAGDLDLPAFDPAVHEALYYVGCTAAYDRRSQQVARALTQVLRAAGVAFGTLGEAEPCCGDAAHSFGQRGYTKELVAANTRLFLEHAATDGPRPLVTTSPHCFDMFRSHYPGLAEAFQPLHYTQYLAQLIEAGRLTFPAPLPLRATFHDPCVLGRGHNEYEAPRRVLAAIAGVELAEMPESRADALCCGGGGGRMWLETPASERFANLRVDQARTTSAEALVTACPYCIACLEDGVKVTADGGDDDLRVLDVAEIAWLALQQAPAPSQQPNGVSR